MKLALISFTIVVACSVVTCIVASTSARHLRHLSFLEGIGDGVWDGLKSAGKKVGNFVENTGKGIGKDAAGCFANGKAVDCLKTVATVGGAGVAVASGGALAPEAAAEETALEGGEEGAEGAEAYEEISDENRKDLYNVREVDTHEGNEGNPKPEGSILTRRGAARKPGTGNKKSVSWAVPEE